MIGFQQKFDLWDEDGSGELDEAEITRGLEGKSTSYQPDQIVDFYDTSGNGRISLRESQAGIKRADEVGSYLQN